MQTRDSILLFVAQGFGIGRLKPGPGTWGTLVGFAWAALLLAPRNAWIFGAGAVAGVFLSVWLCGEAEKILGQKDPGSVVLDEIIAMPFCFAAWIVSHAMSSGNFPGVAEIFSQANAPRLVVVFVAFRVFDIAKPWPVKQSQSLPGGWGVTIDDVLAAVYVNIAWMAARWLGGWP